jgi:hypothetical protein
MRHTHVQIIIMIDGILHPTIAYQVIIVIEDLKLRKLNIIGRDGGI